MLFDIDDICTRTEIRTLMTYIQELKYEQTQTAKKGRKQSSVYTGTQT